MRPAFSPQVALVGITILDPRIGFAFAEAIDRTAAGECSDPRQRLSHLWFVARCTIPYFHEYVLEQIFGVGLVVQNFHTDSAEKGCVTGMEKFETAMVVRLDLFHQVFVAEFGIRSDLGRRGPFE